jgi:hypothetical protein
MINHEPSSLQRRSLFAGFAAFGASAAIGNRPAMAKVEQNALKRRGVGLRTLDSQRASPGFTLFAPHFVQNRAVYLINLKGEIFNTWDLP